MVKMILYHALVIEWLFLVAIESNYSVSRRLLS
jgi:hypothetical protein